MLDLSCYDTQIRQLYTTGTPSLEIARLLDIDLIDVVGRVRAMELQPPGMGVRRQRGAASLPDLMPPRPAPLAADVGVAPVPAEAARPSPAGSAMMAAPQPRRLASPARPGPGPVVAARPVPTVHGRPDVSAVRGLAPQTAAIDEDDEDDCVRTLPGRPRGWLMAEAEVEALFARAGQRFHDVVLKKRV